jgi:hypothetical protein
MLPLFTQAAAAAAGQNHALAIHALAAGSAGCAHICTAEYAVPVTQQGSVGELSWLGEL